MALISCILHSPISLQIDHSSQKLRSQNIIGNPPRFTFSLENNSTHSFGRGVAKVGADLHSAWSFAGGSRIIIQPNLTEFTSYQRRSRVHASLLTNSQIASTVFTLGTAAVLPFYTLMVVAPKAELTRKTMESSIPYVVLGLLYGFLLYLSWTPDTIRLMFASKYWLPELPGIAKMFSNDITLVSAWIHLLVVDLFAARQVFRDGLKNEIETRHSVSLCLLFCPIGIIVHVLTRALTKNAESKIH